MSEAFRFVPLSQLTHPKYRLRESLGDTEQLKASIKEHGILVPLLARPRGDKLEVVAGQRRFLVAHEIDLKVAPVVVKDIDDKTAFEIALVENLERQDMNPIEEARAFRRYIVDNGFGSASELSNKIKRSEAYISRRMDLLNLDDSTLPMIQTGRLSVSHAEQLTGLNAEKASELADQVIKAGMDTNQTRLAAAFIRAGMTVDQATNQATAFPNSPFPKRGETYDPVKVAREAIVSTLQKALNDMSASIQLLPNGESKANWVQIRYELHQLIDRALKQKRKDEHER